MIKDNVNAVFNTYIYYSSITTPTIMYQRQPVKGKPFCNKEYVAKMLLTEQDYKLLKKRYKGVKSIKAIKEIDSAEEFEKEFKIAPPYEAETYFIWKISQKAFYESDGLRNKARVKLGSKGIDLEGKMIGNGSKANVQWRERKFTHSSGNGIALDLIAVQILDLIAYGDDDLAFDMDEVEVEPNFSAESDGDTSGGDGQEEEFSGGAGDHNDYVPDDDDDDPRSSTGDDNDIPF